MLESSESEWIRLLPFTFLIIRSHDDHQYLCAPDSKTIMLITYFQDPSEGAVMEALLWYY